MTKEAKVLRQIAQELLDRHAELMRNNDHDGAAHCPCELAHKFRIADEAWRAASKPKILRQSSVLAALEKGDSKWAEPTK